MEIKISKKLIKFLKLIFILAFGFLTFVFIVRYINTTINQANINELTQIYEANKTTFNTISSKYSSLDKDEFYGPCVIDSELASKNFTKCWVKKNSTFVNIELLPNRGNYTMAYISEFVKPNICGADSTVVESLGDNWYICLNDILYIENY